MSLDEPASAICRLSRRHFLSLSVAAGAATAALVASPLLAQSMPINPSAAPDPLVFVIINLDNSLLIRVNRPDMGQGTMAAMPMLVAEELDADWARVQVDWAPATPAFDAAPLGYGVGGSSAVRETWLPLRRLGAGLRLMLVAAAGRRWNVPADQIRTEGSHVIRIATGERLPYGALAGDLRTADIPTEITLKAPGDFRLIGTRAAEPLTPSKVDGSAVYGIDVDVPGMRIGMMVRPPTSTGKLKSLDIATARALPGVHWIGETPNGVGIVADSFWKARKAREALVVAWEDGDAARWSSPGIADHLTQSLSGAPTLEPIGDAALAAEIAAAPKRLTCDYWVPFEAHAAIEPMNCTAHVQADRAEIWLPTQNPIFDRHTVARELKLSPEAVTVHPRLMGGSFGRKYTPDYILDAVHLSRAVSGPVKLVWTREDDMTHSPYRPAVAAQLAASIDAAGRPAAWDVRIAGPSFAIRSERSIAMLKEREHGIDGSMVEGACPPQYRIPRVRVAQHWTDVKVPVMWWRSVGHSFTAFFIESFVDELAHAAGQDPLAYRLALLREGPSFPPGNAPKGPAWPDFDPARMAAVLEVAAACAGWGRKPGAGRGLGIAGHFSFGTYVAQVVEAKVESGSVAVTEVWTALDCGQVVNPGIIEQQIMGSVIFALGAALKSEITVERGRVQQSNYHEFEVLPLAEAPRQHVEILPSRASPGGIGEPGVPPVAPALANAVFAATGKRIRGLPLTGHGLSLA